MPFRFLDFDGGHNSSSMDLLVVWFDQNRAYDSQIEWLCYSKDSLRGALLLFLGHSSPDLLTFSRVWAAHIVNNRFRGKIFDPCGRPPSQYRER
jgi:hypothetical protein